MRRSEHSSTAWHAPPDSVLVQVIGDATARFRHALCRTCTRRGVRARGASAPIPLPLSHYRERGKKRDEFRGDPLEPPSEGRGPWTPTHTHLC